MKGHFQRKVVIPLRNEITRNLDHDKAKCKMSKHPNIHTILVCRLCTYEPSSHLTRIRKNWGQLWSSAVDLQRTFP